MYKAGLLAREGKKQLNAMSEDGVSDIIIDAVENVCTSMTSSIKLGTRISEGLQIIKCLRQDWAISLQDILELNFKAKE